MNVQGKIQVGEVNQQEEIQNDDKQSLIETVEDANANQITKENIYSDDREHGSPLPPLVSHSEAQERIIIWGTHARCEDPELEEFELLECQELETFVVEEEEQVDMQSERSRKGAKNFSEKEFSSTAISTTVGSPWKDHNENHNVDGDANENSQPLDLRTSNSRSGANRTLRDARSGSEGNVFSSSLSAVTSLSGSLASALDSAGRTQPLSSQSTKSTSDKGRNQHPATTESYIHSERNRELPSDLDQNHNSTTLPQEPQYDRSKLMHPSYGAVKLQKFQMEAEQNAGKRMSTELGVGAVNRTPSATAKNRMVLTGQPKSPLTLSQPMQAVNPTTQTPQEPQDQRKPVVTGLAAKSLLPKPAQSGLRPPIYSHLPPARLAAFGFVRSSSVSSVSSNHSTDSTWSDPCRPAYRPNSVSDEPPPLHRVTTSPPGDGSRAPCRSTPQPPNPPAPTRRSLLPPPRSSPVASRKEFQKSSDGTCSSLSSPKRLAVVSPKPQSPVLQRQQRATVAVRGSSMQILPRTGSPGPEKQKEEEQKKEKEREEIERNEEIQLLQGRCEEQARQLQTLQTELKKTSMSLEVFVVCTQHFAFKSESAEEKERELSQELSRIQHEVAFNAARWERLQKEKRELEECFERELRELQVQQESELTTVEENLRLRHASDRDHLRAEHQSEVEELRTQHQEQIEELTANHEAALEDLKTMHNITMSTLQEEHARTMRDLRKAHEQQKASLEEDFEKLRLSLQDQVDTLTFQNRTLKDKAKRFEEALRKSTDEQIVDVLAPYQHIEEDLKSLKEVLEMKNQQIHDQEKKICHLEKVQAQKNLYLEERVQVLQQQNEDLMARIDRHLTVSRQLSEENANLQEYVEKETNEKKRLSRNNEELLWLLQTSPHLSPSSSPIHRAFFPGPDIPPYPYSPGPGTPTHSCSPGPSPAPGTPTLRGSPAARLSPARIPNANTFSR
ncbi:microtubule-associated tumor suppressor candidate 2-like [Sinocyclocheilus rhinocerous]|uniref:microtubule-associated tumor suppressor candidate 2-like n=1 Tax=Sinocyclocheilus rhinocerous TaxID=307959 RepID=UPI0007B97B5E|nr:PREDICTED: microtubule-associated tumor suppressor candidate 2-like [Sinocyclocheilus rhinocerous]